MSKKKSNTTPWEKVPGYPCPCQCLASRDVKGIHWQLFRTIKEDIEEDRFLFWKTVKVRKQRIFKLWNGNWSKEISEAEADKILSKAIAPRTT